MSHTAVAAVLARDDLSIGERLAALSLASFANREHRAWPGNAAAAARAGLSRSRYLEAREQLLARGLIAVEEAGRGRGQTTTLTTLFAQFGPWWDADINAVLLERVLGRSRTRGAARALLATLAALADDAGAIDDVSTEELSRAAGLADSTYRRARNALLASGEAELVEDGGGRGRLNRWQVRAADAGAAAPVDSALILVAPQETRAWVAQRYRSVIDGAARNVGRRARIADIVESVAIVAATSAVSSPDAPSGDTTADPSYSTSADTSYDTPACALSYTPAYNQPKEVRQC